MRTALAGPHPDPEPQPYAWLRPLAELVPWLRETRDDTVPLTRPARTDLDWIETSDL